MGCSATKVEITAGNQLSIELDSNTIKITARCSLGYKLVRRRAGVVYLYPAGTSQFAMRTEAYEKPIDFKKVVVCSVDTYESGMQLAEDTLYVVTDTKTNYLITKQKGKFKVNELPRVPIDVRFANRQTILKESNDVHLPVFDPINNDSPRPPSRYGYPYTSLTNQPYNPPSNQPYNPPPNRSSILPYTTSGRPEDRPTFDSVFSTQPLDTNQSSMLHNDVGNPFAQHNIRDSAQGPAHDRSINLNLID